MPCLSAILPYPRCRSQLGLVVVVLGLAIGGGSPASASQYYCCPLQSGVTSGATKVFSVGGSGGYWIERTSGQAQMYQGGSIQQWYQYQVELKIHYTGWTSSLNKPCGFSPNLLLALKGIGHCSTTTSPFCRRSNCTCASAWGTFCKPSSSPPNLCQDLEILVTFDSQANQGKPTLTQAQKNAHIAALSAFIQGSFCNPANPPTPTTPFTHRITTDTDPYTLIEGDDCECQQPYPVPTCDSPQIPCP